MELHIIEQFLQLSKTEHMTETADHFNITQSALSKNIAKLEDELGVKLFDRVGRNIRLNKYGENFARYAIQATQALKAGAETTREVKYEILGRICILCRAFSPILTDCIASYSRLNPHVEFILTRNDSSSQNSDLEPDFVLSASSDQAFQGNQVWIAQELYHESYHAIVSAACPALKGHIPQNLSELKDVPFIAMVLHDMFFRDNTYAFCQAEGFTPHILYRSDDFQSKMNLIKEGLAAVFIPESCMPMAKQIIPDMISVPVHHPNGQRTVTLMRKRKQFMTETAMDFWNFAMEHYEINCASPE